MKKSIVVMIIFCSMLSFYSCSNSSEPETKGTITITSKYQNSALQKEAGMNELQININKVTYILREIKFKSQQDSTDGLFKTTPLVLELNLTGSLQQTGGLTVPFGTYNRLEFDIHKAEVNDTLQMSEDQRIKMRPFLTGDRYSVIIEGVVTDGSAQKSFVYRSRVNMKQKLDLPSPLIVSEENNNVNTTMIISSYGWFMDGNSIMDPTDAKNEGKIDNNLRQSIKAFRDKNKDGIADN